MYLCEDRICPHVGDVLGGGLDKKCKYDIGIMGAYQLGRRVRVKAR